MTVAVAVAAAVLTGQPREVYAQSSSVQASALSEAERINSEVIKLYHQGRYGEAIPRAEMALLLREQALGLEHPDVAASLNILAILCKVRGDYAHAEPLYRRALAILEKVGGLEHPDVAASLNNLARLYYAQGDYAQAEPLYMRALAILEKALGPEHPNVAHSLDNLAELYSAKGDYAQAEALHKRALSIQKKARGPEHPDVAKSLNNLAELHRAKGNYVQAESLCKRALAIYEKSLGSEHPNVATSLNNLAGLYQAKGDYAQAEPLYKRALSIDEKALGPDHPGVAASLNNLAVLYRVKGDYAQAEPLHKRALSIVENSLGPEHPHVAQALNNLAVLYRVKGDYARAELLHMRALAIREKALGPEHPSVAQSLNNLAGVYWAKGDYAQAELLYKRSLSIDEKVLGPEHPDVAIDLSNLALLYDARGDYAQAESLYERALAIQEKSLGPEHPDVATSLNNLATLHLAQGDIGEAIRHMEQAAGIEDRNAAAVLMTGSDEQKRVYMVTFRGQTDAGVCVHVQFAPDMPQAKRLALTTILQRKGRVLDAMTDSFAALRRRLPPAEQAQLERLRSVNAQYSALVWRGRDTMDLYKYGRVLARLDEERRTLEDDLSRRSAELQVELRPVRFEEVQAAIPAGAALVELFRYLPFNPKARKLDETWGKARYVAYVLRREGEIAWADLGEAAPIEAAVDAFLKELRRSGSDPAPPARALDALIMQPVRRLLGDTRRVFLSPDDQLNLVPFAALLDEEGHYVVERYAFTYLTSGRDLVRLAATAPSRQGPVVLAAPDYGGAAAPPSDVGGEHPRSIDLSSLQFAPVPFAAEEGRTIGRKVQGAQLLMGAAATEGALKALRGPRLLHIVTHGFFLPDQEASDAPPPGSRSFDFSGLRGAPMPMPRIENPLLRSGLVLAGFNQRRSGQEDGVLTALEASQLDLGGTRLVVMSACETGVGEAKSGDGVYGLRRALVMAGAETQVMSLWKVNDAATRELMDGYYDRLLRDGGRSEAMRQAQLAMLASRDRKHPHFWASFIVSGKDAALDGRPVIPPLGPGKGGCASCAVGASSDPNGGPQRGAVAWLAAIAALGLVSWRRRGRARGAAAG